MVRKTAAHGFRRLSEEIIPREFEQAVTKLKTNRNETVNIF